MHPCLTVPTHGSNTVIGFALQVAGIGSRPVLSGTRPAATPGEWHRVELSVSAAGLTGTLNGEILFARNNLRRTSESGWAVIGTGGYDAGVQFDNLELNASSSPVPPPSPGPPGPPMPPGPPGPGPPPIPCKTPYKGQQVVNLPCSIGADYVGWEVRQRQHYFWSISEKRLSSVPPCTRCVACST